MGTFCNSRLVAWLLTDVVLQGLARLWSSVSGLSPSVKYGNTGDEGVDVYTEYLTRAFGNENYRISDPGLKYILQASDSQCTEYIAVTLGRKMRTDSNASMSSVSGFFDLDFVGHSDYSKSHQSPDSSLRPEGARAKPLHPRENRDRETLRRE